MTTSSGTSKIKLGLAVIVSSSLILAALIYTGMSSRGGSYYARAAQFPLYAGLYGIWLVINGIWINHKQKRIEPLLLIPNNTDARERPVVPRNNNLRRGLYRLALVLTTLWFTVVSAVVFFEYLNRNLECQYSDYDQDCSMFFWSWISQDYDPARLALNMKSVFIVATAPPLAGLLLALSLAWVVRGFSSTNEP